MIKWQDIKLGVSPLTNSIYIGKSKPLANRPGLEEWTDKSGDKTIDVVTATMEWFIARQERDGKDTISITAKDKKYILKLEIEPIEEVPHAAD